MNNKVKLIFLVIGGFIFFLATTVLAEDFSAEMINTTDNGMFKGKIFISEDKIRIETPESVTITRADKELVWLLMPKEKMYMEQPFDATKVVPTSEKISGEIERKLIGQEMIDGKMTNKYQIVYNQHGKTMTIFQWLTSGLKIPLKVAAADNSWAVEYKNISTAKQPDALFEVPSDYQKFSMPSLEDILKGLGR